MELIYKRRIWGYECDIYGHLNNAQYLHLYEEARADALRVIGITVNDFLAAGLAIVLTRAEVDYKHIVNHDDMVEIRTRIIAANRLRSTWEQRLYDGAGNFCSRALIEGVFLRNGRPGRMSQEWMDVFTPWVVLEEA